MTIAKTVHDDVTPIYPSGTWVAVTKSDSTVLVGVRAIYVGTAGNLAVKAGTQTTVTFVGVPAGTLLPISPDYVMAATTAADIVALY